MKKRPGSQDSSESMSPVRSGGPREERAPLVSKGALRPGSQPAHDVLDRGMPLSDFQWARPSSGPAQWLRPLLAAEANETNSHAAREDLGIAATRKDSTVRFVSPQVHESFWSGSSAGSNERSQATVAEKEASEKTEAPSDAALRLSALRGAVSALGMKNLGRRKELPAPHLGRSAQGMDVKAASDASIAIPAGLDEEVYEKPAEAHAPIAVGAEIVMEAAETVAPREFVPVTKSDAPDDWDEDEVRILPARRGQYKS